MKDLMGRGFGDYYYHENSEDLQTETSISELDDFASFFIFSEIIRNEYFRKKH